MVMRPHGVELDAYPPVAIARLVAQTARSLRNEMAVGVTAGHDELRALVERHIDLLTKPVPAVRG